MWVSVCVRPSMSIGSLYPHGMLKTVSNPKVDYFSQSRVGWYEHFFASQLDEITELEAENYTVSIAAIRSFTESGPEGSKP